MLFTLVQNLELSAAFEKGCETETAPFSLHLCLFSMLWGQRSPAYYFSTSDSTILIASLIVAFWNNKPYSKILIVVILLQRRSRTSSCGRKYQNGFWTNMTDSEFIYMTIPVPPLWPFPFSLSALFLFSLSPSKFPHLPPLFLQLPPPSSVFCEGRV